MPSKTICCGEKAVLVSVYVEKPRRVSSKPHQHHPHIRQRRVHHKVDDGPNRRANLLRYAQRLREIAVVESAASSPPHHPSSPASTPPRHTSVALRLPRPSSAASDEPKITTKLIPDRAKRKNSRTPTCFSDFSELIPRFIRSLVGLHGEKEKKEKKKKELSGSAPSKKIPVMKSFNVQQKFGFVTKLLSTFRKPRWH